MSGKETGKAHGWDFLGLGVVVFSAMMTFFALDAGLLAPGYGHIEKAVAAELRDPSSAQFRGIYGSGDTVCGEVNGKNGLGAYSGFRKFVYHRRTVLFSPDEPARGNSDELNHYYEDLARFARLSRDCID